MKAYSITNRKGGVGKSTFSIWTATRAYHLLYGKVRMALIELDDQASTVREREMEITVDKKLILEKLKSMFPKDWGDRIKNVYPIQAIHYRQFIESYKDLEQNYDFVFVDFPGHITVEMMEVLQYIDKIAVPIKASKKDLNASLEFLATASRHNLDIRWFINMYSNTTFEKDFYRKAPELLKKIDPKITPLRWSALDETQDNFNQIVRVNTRPAMSNVNSTIYPFDDSDFTIKALVNYFIKNI